MTESSRYLSSTPHPGLTAEAAANLLTDVGAVGFVYSPLAARFIRRDADHWATDDGNDPFKDVYELCVFTEHRELRWIQESGGKGTAYDRAETGADGPFAFGDARAHLLWGAVGTDSDGTSGWVDTESARVGRVSVPLATAVVSGSRLTIRSQEYAEYDDQGNVSIVDVRYLGLGVASTPATSKSSAGKANHG
ncbi:MAG: CRISPR-associated protein Csx19 [Gordonia sp. (in: high G+C Gram-positive bacteria)]